MELASICPRFDIIIAKIKSHEGSLAKIFQKKQCGMDTKKNDKRRNPPKKRRDEGHFSCRRRSSCRKWELITRRDVVVIPQQSYSDH